MQIEEDHLLYFSYCSLAQHLFKKMLYQLYHKTHKQCGALTLRELKGRRCTGRVSSVTLLRAPDYTDLRVGGA